MGSANWAFTRRGPNNAPPPARQSDLIRTYPIVRLKISPAWTVNEIPSSPDALESDTVHPPAGPGRRLTRPARHDGAALRAWLAEILKIFVFASLQALRRGREPGTMGAGVWAASVRRHGEVRRRAADRKSAAIDAARSRPGYYEAYAQRPAS